MVDLMLANCWPTVRNIRLAVPLVNELFTNEGPIVVKPLAVQIRFKLAAHCRHINPIIPQTAKDEPSICATWVSFL